MPDEVGSMSVAYTIVVNQALKSLNMLKTGITDVIKKTQEWNESGDKQESKLKAIGKAWAVVGAVATGALYGIMKASSYAAIYTRQFGAQLQRVANIIMEKTGLNVAIESALEVFDRFIDRIDDGNLTFEEFIDTLKDIKKWWDELSSTSKVIIAIGSVLAIIGSFIGAIIAGGIIIKGFVAGFVAIKGAVILVGVALLGIPLWIAAIIGAVLGLIIVWVLWKTGVLRIIAELGEKFRTWLSGLMISIGTWLINLQTKIGEKIDTIIVLWEGFKTTMTEIFDSIWTYITTGLTTMKDTFVTKISEMITWVSDLIAKIISIPSLPSWLGGGGSGGGSRDFGPDYDEPGGGSGGTYPSSQFGGPIKGTGLRLLHSGEYVVPKSGAPISSGGSGNTYNITTNVNVAPGTSNNMVNDISRQVSKAVADEIKRVSKV